MHFEGNIPTMKHMSVRAVLGWGLMLVNATVMAGKFDARIPMSVGSAMTYYVQASLGDLQASEFMVDTGSGYLTISRQTLNQLLDRGLARYKRELPGVLADGSQIEVPVYQVSQFRIGPCLLENVEAAVFPSTQRQIIGLNVLSRSSPFIFSMNPPELVLSHCSGNGLAKAEDSSYLPHESFPAAERVAE
jgi:predicted aspartyl protease